MILLLYWFKFVCFGIEKLFFVVVVIMIIMIIIIVIIIVELVIIIFRIVFVSKFNLLSL